MTTSPTSVRSANANSIICLLSKGLYSLNMTNSMSSQSWSEGNPANLLILSSTLWQWNELCSVSKYNTLFLLSGKLAS